MDEKDVIPLKVLVTGATGFLGSHLTKRLIKEGFQVIVLKRSFSNCNRIADVLPDISAYDLDRVSLDMPFREHSDIAAVIHAATRYGRGDESFSELAETNVIFPLQLIEKAASSGVPLFINTDTFINTDPIVYSHLIGYATSKKHFLEWGRRIAEAERIRFVNVRLEHLYGPLDSDDKFVPHVIKSCLGNLPALPLTPGMQQRDFIYVEDAVNAYMTLLRKAAEIPDHVQCYELGTGTACSIRAFVETAHRIAQSSTVLQFGALPYRDNEIMYSKANIEPLTSLGWANRFTLTEGIQAIVNAERREKH